jgi:hypothetical protein
MKVVGEVDKEKMPYSKGGVCYLIVDDVDDQKSDPSSVEGQVGTSSCVPPGCLATFSLFWYQSWR